MKRVIFQNFGWKIRVLSPGDNGAPSSLSLQGLILPLILTTFTTAEILLWKVNHKRQNKKEALTVNDSFLIRRKKLRHRYKMCWSMWKCFSRITTVIWELAVSQMEQKAFAGLNTITKWDLKLHREILMNINNPKITLNTSDSISGFVSELSVNTSKSHDTMNNGTTMEEFNIISRPITIT